MSKELYESQVAKDAAKRFKMLCEYTFNLSEDDGEELPEGEPGMEGGAAPQPQDGSADGQMPPMDNGMGGEEMPPMDGSNPQPQEGGAPGFNPQEPMDGGDMSTDSSMGGEMEDPMGDGMDGSMPTEPMQPDDEVIDIDELTNSQEETEEKVDKANHSLAKVSKKLENVISKLTDMLDANTANMEELKRELERRNPTPLEKLNMRSVNDSHPFNVKPTEYWKDKEANSNYRVGENDEPKTYTITQSDVDKINDFSTISKELSQASVNQNLANIFGLR